MESKTGLPEKDFQSLQDFGSPLFLVSNVHQDAVFFFLGERLISLVRLPLRADHHPLSFSKKAYMHHLVTRWFIVEYNIAISYNHVF